MKSYLLVGLAAILATAAVIPAVRGQPASPPAPTGVGGPDADAGSGGEAPIDADAIDGAEGDGNGTLAVAAATIPQLSAARGGTLGLPSQGADPKGLQANVDTQLLGDPGNTNIFTKLGGLRLTANLRADVFAEVANQDIPRLVLDGVTVGHRPSVEKVSAGAVRLRYQFWHWLFFEEEEERARAACEEAKDTYLKGENSTYEDYLRAAFQPGKTSQTSKDFRLMRRKCGNGKTVGVSTSSLSLGVRILRHSGASADSAGANGAAFETLLQHDKDTLDHGWTIFLGLSGMKMNAGSEPVGMATSEFPAFSILRLSLGGEVRGAASDGASLASRFGGYAILSRGTWSDPYTFGAPRSDTILSNEAEIGIYAGGQFSNSYKGMVALRLLKPFGTHEETQYILSFIPAVTSTPGGTP